MSSVRHQISQITVSESALLPSSDLSRASAGVCPISRSAQARDLGHRAHQKPATLEAPSELDVEEEGCLDARHEAEEAEDEEEAEQQVPHHVVQHPAHSHVPCSALEWGLERLDGVNIG